MADATMEENRVSADTDFRDDDFTPAGPRTAETAAPPLRRRDLLRPLGTNRVAAASLAVIAAILLFALLAPALSPYTYREVRTERSSLPPRIPGLERLGFLDGTRGGVDEYGARGLEEIYHYFGTDSLGRDIWTRTAHGTRISLLIAGAAVGIDVVFGVAYGMVSGYRGGWTDTVLQRIVEVVSGVPLLVVVTLLLVALRPGLVTIIAALCLTGWINMSRIVRAQVLRLKEREYVLASRTLGASGGFVLVREILPNAMGQIIVTLLFSIPNAIFLEAFLAFIGLGIPEPQASLGSMIYDGYQSAMIYPHMVLAPVVVMGLLMLSFNLFADGLRDAVDPRMKQL